MVQNVAYLVGGVDFDTIFDKSQVGFVFGSTPAQTLNPSDFWVHDEKDRLFCWLPRIQSRRKNSVSLDVVGPFNAGKCSSINNSDLSDAPF